MRRLLALGLALWLLTGLPSSAVADSLSITAWSTGDALNAANLNSRHTTIQNWANGSITNTNIGSSAAIVGSKLDLTSGTGRLSNSTSVTDSAPVITSAQTWNDVAEVFTGWRLSITNTNSASTSRLLDLQVDSTVIASISRVGQLYLNSQNYASGPRTLMDGAWFNVASATYTDNITAASGTALRFIAYAFQRPAVAAGNSSVTTTNAATVFIASAPVAGDNMTLTNRYALWVDQGDVRIGGNLFASGSVTFDAGLFTRISGGTVAGPGIGAANSFMAFSGGTAGYTWFDKTGATERMRLTDAGILALGTTVTAGAAGGALVTSNATSIRGVNAAGTTTLAMITIDSSNNVHIAAGGQDIRWGAALIALGGGSSATLGTIGGSGPATATQDTWMRVMDSNGAAFWVPAFK